MSVTVFEIGSRFVMPSLRRRMVEVLYKDYRMNQMEIANLLHITQSAVSRYLSGGRGKLIDISKYKDINEDLTHLIDLIVEKKPSSIEIQKQLLRLSFRMFSRGYLCELHGKLDSSIEVEKCNICSDLFSKIA